MQVTEKGQTATPKRLRDATGILPNSRVPLVQKNREANIRTIGVEVDDRREALRVAAAKVRASMAEPFRHMDSDALMAFLRPDDGHA